MSEEKKHGPLGKFFKIIMVIVFVLIGAGLIALGAYSIATGKDIGTYEGEEYKLRWLSIVNIVFGCLLLTSPFFLKKTDENRGPIEKIIKIIMVVLFIVIGITLIAGGAYALAHKYSDLKVVSICNIIFGALLFTSPLILKK